MQFKAIKRPTFYIRSRKYRFLLSEFILFSAFWILYSWIMTVFPVMDSTTASNLLSATDYSLYMFFMMIGLFFVALAVFLLGVWWQQWRSDKHVQLA